MVARSIPWINDVLLSNNGQVPIGTKELAVMGLADVVRIDPCPPKSTGQGRLVTGTTPTTSSICRSAAHHGRLKPPTTTRSGAKTDNNSSRPETCNPENTSACVPEPPPLSNPSAPRNAPPGTTNLLKLLSQSVRFPQLKREFPQRRRFTS